MQPSRLLLCGGLLSSHIVLICALPLSEKLLGIYSSSRSPHLTRETRTTSFEEYYPSSLNHPSPSPYVYEPRNASPEDKAESKRRLAKSWKKLKDWDRMGRLALGSMPDSQVLKENRRSPIKSKSERDTTMRSVSHDDNLMHDWGDDYAEDFAELLLPGTPNKSGSSPSFSTASAASKKLLGDAKDALKRLKDKGKNSRHVYIETGKILAQLKEKWQRTATTSTYRDLVDEACRRLEKLKMKWKEEAKRCSEFATAAASTCKSASRRSYWSWLSPFKQQREASS